MASDVGLLLLRVVVGAYLFAHGTQKLFGWFGGHGLAGTGAGMGMMGFRPPALWAIMAGVSEAGGGLLLLVGLLNPLGTLGIAAAMLTATFAVHWHKGPFNTNGGYELPVTNVAAALAVALAGPGRYSLDAPLGIALPEPATGLLGGALVLLGLALAFGTRRPAAAPPVSAAGRAAPAQAA
jgi:putative oxidoreductase